MIHITTQPHIKLVNVLSDLVISLLPSHTTYSVIQYTAIMPFSYYSSNESLSSITSAKSWRSNSSSQSSCSSIPASELPNPTVEPGKIYNLGDDEVAAFHGVNPDILHHPVAVLEVQGPFAKVMIISSLRKQKLEDYQRGRDSAERVHMEHVPIYPVDRHFLTGEQLQLAEGRRFQTNCYLKIKQLHEVPVACLKPYSDRRNGKQLEFSTKSWDLLLHIRASTDEERRSSAVRTPSPSSSISSVQCVPASSPTSVGVLGNRRISDAARDSSPDAAPRSLNPRWVQGASSYSHGGRYRRLMETRNWREPLGNPAVAV